MQLVSGQTPQESSPHQLRQGRGCQPCRCYRRPSGLPLALPESLCQGGKAEHNVPLSSAQWGKFQFLKTEMLCSRTTSWGHREAGSTLTTHQEGASAIQQGLPQTSLQLLLIPVEQAQAGGRASPHSSAAPLTSSGGKRKVPRPGWCPPAGKGLKQHFPHTPQKQTRIASTLSRRPLNTLPREPHPPLMQAHAPYSCIAGCEAVLKAPQREPRSLTAFSPPASEPVSFPLGLNV